MHSYLSKFVFDLVAEHPIPEEDRNLSRESDGERRVATPTATESQLPWKRQGDECTDAVQQNEFPAWASNKEYLAYNSPSATFLGNVYIPTLTIFFFFVTITRWEKLTFTQELGNSYERALLRFFFLC